MATTEDNDDGDGATGDEVEDDGDGVTGDGTTGYDYGNNNDDATVDEVDDDGDDNDYGDGRRRR